MSITPHVYEVRRSKDHRGVDLSSDALPFGRLWYTRADDAIGYAKHSNRSHDAAISVYDEAGNVTEAHEHACDFIEPRMRSGLRSSNRTSAKPSA